jgi:hypothetical protein
MYVACCWKGTSSRGRMEKDILVAGDGRVVDVRDMAYCWRSQDYSECPLYFRGGMCLETAICVLNWESRFRDAAVQV